MTLFITFVATILGQVANNVASEVAASNGTIDQIVQDMPRDLGIMVVNFVTGMNGLMTAVAGMLS
jgi:hypothetical protein